MRTKFYQK